MNVERMKALVEAIRGVDEPEWMKWRRIPVVKHGVPNPLLMAYCCSGLQDSYTAIYTDKHAVINRTDGDYKWRLAAHFGVSDELVGRIFGTGGCEGAITPKACAEYVQGLIDAHEQALDELVARGRAFAQDVIAGVVYPVSRNEVTQPNFPFDIPADIGEHEVVEEEEPTDVDYEKAIKDDEWLFEEEHDVPEYLDTSEEAGDFTPPPKVTSKKK